MTEELRSKKLRSPIWGPVNTIPKVLLCQIKKFLLVKLREILEVGGNRSDQDNITEKGSKRNINLNKAHSFFQKLKMTIKEVS